MPSSLVSERPCKNVKLNDRNSTKTTNFSSARYVVEVWWTFGKITMQKSGPIFENSECISLTYSMSLTMSEIGTEKTTNQKKCIETD